MPGHRYRTNYRNLCTWPCSLLESSVGGERILAAPEMSRRWPLQAISLSLVDKVVLDGVLSTVTPTVLAGTLWPSPVVCGPVVRLSISAGRRPRLHHRVSPIVLIIGVVLMMADCIEVGGATVCANDFFGARAIPELVIGAREGC